MPLPSEQEQVRGWEEGVSRSALEKEPTTDASIAHLLLCEPLHDMRVLLPSVHSLLVLYVTLVQQDVEDGQVLDVLVGLEPSSDLGPDLGWRHVKRI